MYLAQSIRNAYEQRDRDYLERMLRRVDALEQGRAGITTQWRDTMSYSVGPVRGATKILVIEALAAAFDSQVLPGQPVHAHDRDAHLANVERQLALLPEPGDGQEYSVSMNGWLSWTASVNESDRVFTSGGFGGGASLVNKA